jgi:hypothetical protein
MGEQGFNDEITFNYLKETKISRYLANLLLIVTPVIFLVLFVKTATALFNSYFSDILMAGIYIILVIAVVSAFRNLNKQYIITVGSDRIIVNNRIINICDIKYMGIITFGKVVNYTIITQDSDEIVINLSKQCDNYLYRVCKTNNIKTDTRRSKTARTDLLLTIIGAILPIALPIIIVLLFKLFVHK